MDPQRRQASTQQPSAGVTVAAMNATLPTARRSPVHLLLALAISGAGWLAVRVTLANGAGVAEARFIATQATVALALFAVVLLTASENRVSRRLSSVFLLLLLAPTLALIGLPYGTRLFAAAVILAPAAVAVVLLWHGSLRKGKQQQLDVATIAAAIAIAALLEPVALVTGSVEVRLELIASALALGAGTAWLRRAWGLKALCAAAAVIVLSGVNLFAGFALLATAAIETGLRSTSNRVGRDRALRLSIAAILVGAACYLSWAGLFLVMAIWAQRARRGWMAAMVVFGALLALAQPSRPWAVVGEGLALLTLLFPFAVAQMLRDESATNWISLRLDSDRLWRLLTGLALAAVAMRTLDPGLALIPAALHWCAPFQPKLLSKAQQEADISSSSLAEAHGLMNTGRWLGLWLAALALGAGYPWLRPPALLAQVDAAREIGGRPSLGAVLVCTTLALLFALVSARIAHGAENRSAWRRHLGMLLLSMVLALSVTLVLWGMVPRPLTTLQTWPPKILTAEAPELRLPLTSNVSPQFVSAWVDSFLANAAALEPGTIVAQIALVGGATPSEAVLRSGTHTAEWSNADLVGVDSVGPENPQPFAYRWSDETPPRLGQRFRTRLILSPETVSTQPAPMTAPQTQAPLYLRIDRNPALPPGVQIQIDRVAIAAGPRL